MTVQAQRGKDKVQARVKVWDAIMAKVVWADHPRQDRAVIVYAPNAAKRLFMQPDSLAITGNVRNAEQK